MRRRIGVAVVALAITLLFGSQAAFAGSPHFVTADASASGNTLTVNFKEGGLGNEPQVHIVLSATALCINGGGKHPKAVEVRDGPSRASTVRRARLAQPPSEDLT